jgi:hypothetical protein
MNTSERQRTSKNVKERWRPLLFIVVHHRSLNRLDEPGPFTGKLATSFR